MNVPMMLRRGALLAATMLASGALAQVPEPAAAVAAGTALDTVMITAQRRPEMLQDVPVAVSAFPASQLAARGIASPLRLMHDVPNTVASHNPGLGSANIYYIRGLGSAESIATFDPPVGTVVDDIPLSRQNGNDIGFFDIERVEVLRGPQSILFGRNMTGGAVNVILKKPSERLGGYVEAAYGAYGKTLVRGSLDLPLSTGVQMKLSGYYQNDRGYVRNTTTGERLNDSDMAGLRGAVQFKFTDRLTWNLAAAYMRNDSENLLNFTCDPRNPSNCKGRFATTGMRTNPPFSTAGPYAGTLDAVSLQGGRVVPVDAVGRKASFGLGNQVDTQMYTSNLEWAGEAFTVNLITGFIDLKQKYALDFADGRTLPNVASPAPAITGFARGGFTVLNDGTHRQTSNELKINGKLFGGLIDYVAGVAVYSDKNTTDFADLSGPNLLLADRVVRNATTAKAGYVQADLNVSEQLKLTAGVRYTDEKKTFSVADNRFFCNTPGAPARCLNDGNLVVATAAGNVAIPQEQRTKAWTPRVAISFRPTDDTLLFASATRGFKSGGWNGRGLTPDALLPFDPEKLWSYEAGARTEFFDRRLRLNLTGFWLEAKALQTASAFIDPQTGATAFVTGNAAGYRNRGLEVEVTAVPVRGLNLTVSAGYQNARYKVGETLLPSRYGVKAVRQQQLDCRAQLAARRVPLAPAGPDNAPDCAAGIVDANGDIATPVRTPKLSIAAGGSYDFAIPAAGIILQPSVNAVYRSRLETAAAGGTLHAGSITAASGAVFPANPFGGDVLGGSLTRASWQVSAALALRTDDNNWLLSLECDNCFDTAFAQSSLANTTYLNPPRTWTVRARRVF